MSCRPQQSGGHSCRHKGKEPGFLLTLKCLRYLSFWGSEPSAACGRLSEESEWLRSTRDEDAPPSRTFVGYCKRGTSRLLPVADTKRRVSGMGQWATPSLGRQGAHWGPKQVTGGPSTVHICIKNDLTTVVVRSCVRVTYLPGQSPAKYCRRT